MKTQISPLLTRSIAAASLACAFSTLPLSFARAQAPTSPGQVNTGEQDATATKSTVPDSGAAVNKTGAKLTAKEKQFMNKAGAGNAAEVQLAELALKNGESQAIKDFADKMITDHKAANESLDAIAKSHGIADFTPSVKDEDKATYAQMTSMKGSAFDTAYAKHAVSDHEMDLKEYKQAKTMVKDKELLAYTEKTEGIVAGHLKMAKELANTKTSAVNH